jgi:hypothetical protein
MQVEAVRIWLLLLSRTVELGRDEWQICDCTEIKNERAFTVQRCALDGQREA